MHELSKKQTEYLQTWATYLVEGLLENNFITQDSPKELAEKMLAAVSLDVGAHVLEDMHAEYTSPFPKEEDASCLTSLDAHVAGAARRRWPHVARCIDAQGGAKMKRDRPIDETLEPMAKAPVTIDTLGQVAEHLSAHPSPRPPHWRVQVLARGWRIEEEHLSPYAAHGTTSITLVMEAPTLQEAATRMVAHSRAMRELGVLP